MRTDREAKFMIGQVVRHRLFDFRGIVFDVDPTFANTEEWWEAIPEKVRPNKDQPFYHLLAVRGEETYVAYASEANLVIDQTDEPITHPEACLLFDSFENGRFRPKNRMVH
jgi:heat shock protein HspQ